MLDAHGLNYLALLVALVINMAVGSLWYSQSGFGKLWSKLSGVDMMKMPKSEANQAIAFMALSAAVQTLALGVVIHSLGATRLIDGVVIGLVLWAGFTAATTIGNTLYSRLSWKYWWLNSSFFLVVMVGKRRFVDALALVQSLVLTRSRGSSIAFSKISVRRWFISASSCFFFSN